MKIKSSFVNSSSDDFKVIYPPRPKSKVLYTQLPTFEKFGEWCVQRKFNGTRTLVHISPGRNVNFINCHGEKHKRWNPPNDLHSQILSLDLESKEYWLDCELLHEKTSNPNYKNKLVLFDVLCHGKYLFRSLNLQKRLELLSQICKSPKIVDHIALKVSNNILMAETFYDNFLQRYKEMLQFDEIEGVVLKKYTSVLDNDGRKPYDVSWQVRCRKPHKNYSF